MNQPKLGEQLIHVRKLNGLTQEELAEKCGITVRTIQRIESGIVNPRLYTIKLLSEILEYNFLASVKNSSKLLNNVENTNVNEMPNKQWYIIDLLNFKRNTMQKIIVFISVWILGAIGAYVFLSSKEIDGINWKADLEFLTSELPQKHYNFTLLNGHDSFSKKIRKLARSSSKMSDFDVALSLQKIIASLGDSHTRVRWGSYINKDMMLPLQLYWFNDGMYILKTNTKNKTILGKKLIAINGFPIEQISKKLSSIIAISNQAVLKMAIPELIKYVELLNYFNIVEGEQISLTLKDELNNELRHTLTPEFLDNLNVVSVKPDSIALCFQNREYFFIDYNMHNNEVYYLQYNNCWSKELELQYGEGKNASFMPSFTAFEDKVIANLKESNYEKLVLDLRFNGGGNSYQGRQFIKKIEKYISEKGMQFYVIVGRKTSSSAIMNAIDAMGVENAIMVGEETSGSPNHFGEIKRIELPNSKLVIRYSTKYFKKVAGDAKSLIPDNYFDMSYNDFKNGVDPVYDWIVAQ